MYLCPEMDSREWALGKRDSGASLHRLAIRQRQSVSCREWKKNDWRNQHGEPRENSDLWNQLLSAHSKAGITVHFEWTLGKKSPV